MHEFGRVESGRDDLARYKAMQVPANYERSLVVYIAPRPVPLNLSVYFRQLATSSLTSALASLRSN